MTLEMLSPGAVGQQYVLEDKDNYQVIQATGIPGANGTDFRHLYNLGIHPGDQSNVMLDACGHESNFPILKALGIDNINRRLLGSDRHIFGRGTEFKYRGFVRSIVTGNGTGLASIDIEVGATLPDGTNSSLNILARLMTLEAQSGEQFIVTAVTTNGDGYQVATVVRKNGAQNLVVASNNNADFLVGTYFVTMSAERDRDPSVGFQSSAQWNVNYQKEEVWLSNKTDSYTSNGLVLNQKSVASSDFVLFQLTGARMADGSVNDGTILGYVTRQEALHFARFISQNYYSMIYEQPNTNESVDVLPGGGLIPQCAPEMRFQIAPSAVNFQTLENLVDEMKQANPFMGPVIHVCAGMTSFGSIMRSIQADRPTTYMAAPSQTAAGVPYKDIWLGQTIKGVLTTYGVEIQFHQIEILDNKPYSTSNSPSRPRAGSKSSDIFIIDPSPMMNMPMPDEGRPGQDWDGEPITMPYNKIEMLGKKEGSLQDYWMKGTIGPKGERVNGEVYNMARQIQRQVEHFYGIALHDPRALMYVQAQ